MLTRGRSEMPLAGRDDENPGQLRPAMGVDRAKTRIDGRASAGGRPVGVFGRSLVVIGAFGVALLSGRSL